jgi:hypothetical protein
MPCHSPGVGGYRGGPQVPGIRRRKAGTPAGNLALGGVRGGARDSPFIPLTLEPWSYRPALAPLGHYPTPRPAPGAQEPKAPGDRFPTVFSSLLDRFSTVFPLFFDRFTPEHENALRSLTARTVLFRPFGPCPRAREPKCDAERAQNHRFRALKPLKTVLWNRRKTA